MYKIEMKSHTNIIVKHCYSRWISPKGRIAVLACQVMLFRESVVNGNNWIEMGDCDAVFK